MNAVITGSTQGIGLGLAREFLRRGHDVMISSRRPQAVDQIVSDLRAEWPEQNIGGRVCDVADYGQVQNLWDRSSEILGSVDIWVNNAGVETGADLFYKQERETIARTVATNLIGLMYCNQIAINGMYRQERGGKIFNMEGFGSNGMVRPRVSVYGSTKRAVRHFTKSMALELKGSKVKVCYLSPGIVITDLLVPPPEKRGPGWEESKKILNLLADTVETVTPFLVEGMLNVKEGGEAVRWLTPQKIMQRKLMSYFKKRDVFTPLGL
ncbi:MAG: SDR family oxidoreductase [Gammaproteobacteria bacterium]|jgi:short-subunit dehydrogenase|nr:SDR family oxidoreductase [Gammaproteobacteria bacterium]MDP6617716.1 SDR family oxidoreductase [Gammaproteobacteria bacterium]MDP6695675.1 SDR family oxidoreductase [Gammaproteobacteria bacterium]